MLLIAAGARRASVATHCEKLVMRHCLDSWLAVPLPCDAGAALCTVLYADFVFFLRRGGQAATLTGENVQHVNIEYDT